MQKMWKQKISFLELYILFKLDIITHFDPLVAFYHLFLPNNGEKHELLFKNDLTSCYF